GQRLAGIVVREQTLGDLLHEHAALGFEPLQLATELRVPGLVVRAKPLVEQLRQRAGPHQPLDVLAHAADYLALQPPLVDGQDGLGAGRRLRDGVPAPVAARLARVLRRGLATAATHDWPLAGRALDQARQDVGLLTLRPL